MKIRLAMATILTAMGIAQVAAAQDAGDWIVRTGFHSIEPKSRNHALVEVENRRPHLHRDVHGCAELGSRAARLAAVHARHHAHWRRRGCGTDLLQPTLSAQYHFDPNGRVRPYVGAGLNYTIFSDGRTGARCKEPARAGSLVWPAADFVSTSTSFPADRQRRCALVRYSYGRETRRRRPRHDQDRSGRLRTEHRPPLLTVASATAASTARRSIAAALGMLALEHR